MWHRGARITGRDIFDFALIAEREPEQLMSAGRFMTRHADALYRQLEQRYEPLRKQFDAVDTIHDRPVFADGCDVLQETPRLMKAVASP